MDDADPNGDVLTWKGQIASLQRIVQEKDEVGQFPHTIILNKHTFSFIFFYFLLLSFTFFYFLLFSFAFFCFLLLSFIFFCFLLLSHIFAVGIPQRR